MTVTETMNDVETRLLEGLSSLHEQLVDVNQKAAERMTELRSNGPELPELTEMPSPTEAVQRYYDFAGKILDANRQFAEQVVGAWYPAPTKAASAKTRASK